MKKIQELAAALTLLVLLSTSALAGEMSTNVVPPPPPPASVTATAPGEIPTGAPASAVDSDTLLTEITLSLLQLLSVI
jgi:hypothetical protein